MLIHLKRPFVFASSGLVNHVPHIPNDHNRDACKPRDAHHVSNPPASQLIAALCLALNAGAAEVAPLCEASRGDILLEGFDVQARAGNAIEWGPVPLLVVVSGH